MRGSEGGTEVEREAKRKLDNEGKGKAASRNERKEGRKKKASGGGKTEMEDRYSETERKSGRNSPLCSEV